MLTGTTQIFKENRSFYYCYQNIKLNLTVITFFLMLYLVRTLVSMDLHKFLKVIGWGRAYGRVELDR